MKMNRTLGSLVAALSLLAGTAMAEVREMRMGIVTPPSHVWTKVGERIAERLPEASGGSMTLSVFPGGQLGSEQDMFQQMSTGLLDVGLMTAAISSLRAPSMQAWFTPYLFESVEAAVPAAATPAAQEMLGELESAGLIGLGYTFAGMRNILLKQGVVTSADDLANKKVRVVPFPAMQIWWNAVGAVPTPVNLPDVYSALQSGLLDGLDIDLDALIGGSFQDVGKGLTISNHMTWPAVMIVSGATWATMSDEEKQIFTEVVDEALAWGSAQQIEAEKTNLATLKGEIEVAEMTNGVELFGEANQAVIDSFAGNEIISRFYEQVKGAAN